MAINDCDAHIIEIEEKLDFVIGHTPRLFKYADCYDVNKDGQCKKFELYESIFTKLYNKLFKK
jgi:hypothetical protein